MRKTEVQKQMDVAKQQKNIGLVMRSTGSWYDVRREDTGEMINCKIKGKFKIAGIKSTNPIAVGDKVKFILGKEGETSVITNIEKRKNYIIRKSINLSKQTHIIATNIDYALLVVTISKPRTSLGFIDRFLLSSEAYHIPTVLIFNKSDLNNPEEQKKQEEWISIYQKIGYKCIATSAKTGQGIQELHAIMKQHICMFGGHSGVGKSALVNAIQPGLKLKTAEISDFNLKGRHTTTFAEMHSLNIGGYIIDTPGIKEFGLVDFKKEDVSGYFPDIRKYMHDCKFSNCIHQNEPKCAVKLAVQAGDIAQTRYNNYLAILNDDSMNQNSY